MSSYPYDEALIRGLTAAYVNEPATLRDSDVFVGRLKAKFISEMADDEMRAECSRRNLHRASTETLTDDQLINEWRRRFPASRLLVCHATDDQLRAECERRSIKGLTDGRLVRGTRAHCLHGMRMDSTCLLCGFAFDFISERDGLKAEVARLTKERDELKKALFQMQNAAIDLAKRDSCTVRGVTFVATARVGEALVPQNTMGRKFVGESGEGIRRLPERTDEHYVLLEDLVAEDV